MIDENERYWEQYEVQVMRLNAWSSHSASIFNELLVRQQLHRERSLFMGRGLVQIGGRNFSARLSRGAKT